MDYCFLGFIKVSTFLHINLSTQPKYKKRKREEFRKAAAKAISPRFDQGDEMEWTSSETTVQRSQSQEDSIDLCHVLHAIARGNHHRAGQALSRMLLDPSNAPMLKVVQQSIAKEDSAQFDLYKLIISGIHDSNQYHTKSAGTRTIAAETFVKNNVAACVFNVVKQNENVRMR